jgi:hypothetical protein
MRRILEDAAVLYRQELESLQLIAAPAVVLGPLLVIIATGGLPVALATIPAFLVLYLLSYAACVSAAGAALHNSEPTLGACYADALRCAPVLARLAAPAGLLLAGVFGAALVLSDIGFGYAGALFGLLGAGAGLFWASRHAYDQPLVILHQASAEEAAEVSERFWRDETAGTLLFLGAVALPLVPVLLLSWALGAALLPIVGAGLFVLVLALWLPFAALALTIACDRMIEEATRQPEPAPASQTGYARPR